MMASLYRWQVQNCMDEPSFVSSAVAAVAGEIKKCLKEKVINRSTVCECM